MFSKITAAVLFLILCILPGSKAGFFDGLPLSAPEIILAFFIFLCIFSTHWEKSRRTGQAIFLLLAIFLSFQFLSSALLPYGWSVCLNGGEIRKIGINSACEPSIESPSGNRSFIYRNIHFSKENLPLYFLNSWAYNFYHPEKGEPDRNSLPFTLEAETYVYPQKETAIAIKSGQKLDIRINDRVMPYSDTNKEVAFNLIPNTVNHVSIRLVSTQNFKKNSLFVDMPGNNPFSSPEGARKMNAWANFYKDANAILLLALCFFFAKNLFFRLKELEKSDRLFLFLLGTYSLVFFFLVQNRIIGFHNRSISFSSNFTFVVFSIALIGSSWYYSFRKVSARKAIAPFLIAVLFLNSCIFTLSRISPEENTLFTGGNDELTHESFSRAINSATTLGDFLKASQVESSVFYYQPLHRYFLALFHKFWGESMWGPYLAQTYIFSLAFMFLTLCFRVVFGSAASISFGLIYFLLMSITWTSPLRLMQRPLQQSTALPLVIVGIALIFFMAKKNELSWKNYAVLGITWGAIFMMRTDWIPVASGIFLFIIFECFRRRSGSFARNTLLPFGIGLVVFPLFIGIRNYLVSGTFAVMPTSGFVNLIPEVKSAIDKKIDIHENSTVKFITEINTAFSDHYSDLFSALWKNIHTYIIDNSLVGKFLWPITGILLLINISTCFMKKKWQTIPFIVMACILVSFVSLIFVSAFFGQHNGVAMLGVYDFFLVTLFAININILFEQPYVSSHISRLRKTLEPYCALMREKLDSMYHQALSFCSKSSKSLKILFERSLKK